MKKTFLFLAALLTVTVMNLNAYTAYDVRYIDANGVEQICPEATVVENASTAVTWNAGWYVVYDSNVSILQAITCSGAVHLILADDAQLNAPNGIVVSGSSNSFTIYGQFAQNGQLIATGDAAGAAGIGGGFDQPGSNITINGGTITATGGVGTNGGGAGIGGGGFGIGSNITINGGTVTATGSNDAAGIGGGSGRDGKDITINGGKVTATGAKNNVAGIGGGEGGGEALNIYVSPDLILKADNNNPPTTEIAHASITTNVASFLDKKRYATIALEPITYLAPLYKYENNPTTGISGWETRTCTDYKVVKDASDQVVWATGWYVVKGSDVNLSKGAIYNGVVHLILADGAKLTATGISESYAESAGIQSVDGGTEIHIYGQANQTGTLIATGGGSYEAAAGIGGGYMNEGDEIYINGGIITATGGEGTDGGAAGIGGASYKGGWHITINGGEVTATGGKYAAGIGGGVNGESQYVTINGGTVTANGNSGGAGIGGGTGSNGYSRNTRINGGTVTATGSFYSSSYGAGIGSGVNGGSSSLIYVDPSIVLKAGDSANPTAVIAPNREATTDIAGDLAGKQYATATAPLDPISYIAPVYNTAGDPKSGIQRWDTLSCTDYTVVADASSAVTWNAGWYVVTGADVTLSAGATCNGAVNLILADGAKLTSTGCVVVSGDANSFTIYGQTEQSGQLIATGSNGAGIGGGYQGAGSNITINGGEVTATGSNFAAGIGGGYQGAGSNITINGGKVTATGNNSGAGIGGGNHGLGSNITINGGEVTATGGNNAAGIGGGYQGAGSNITINGGEVTATGGNSGAGIGGGDQGSGSNITINGGTVNATGGESGAGIGGGAYASGSNITINGGEVTANGGDYAAGIGGGDEGSGSNITINGGEVTANGGNYAPGIGSGVNGDAASNIFVNPSIVLKAGSSLSSIAVIAPDREATTDIAGDLAGKRYTTVTAPLDPIAYIAPVYNTTGDPKSGIQRWDTLSCTDYTVVEDASTAVTWNAGWYIVNGADVTLSKGATCNGAVNLILADGAKLTVSAEEINEVAGITVSGDNNFLTIYGQTEQTGQLSATGGPNAAGIGSGSGFDISGSNITINGGTVNATGGESGAGIGGGAYASGSNITINGGEVTATGGNDAPGIGSGDGGNAASNIFVNPSIVLKAGSSPSSIEVIAPTREATTDIAGDLAGKQYTTVTAPEPIAYLAPVYNTAGDPKSGIKEWKTDTCTSYRVVADASSQVTWNAGWYVVDGADVTLSAGAVCNGAVNLILADGAKLTSTGCIVVSGDANSFTIYGQTEQSGQLIATGGDMAAGIGGGEDSSGSNITINGGNVTATGDPGAAGIGGGAGGSEKGFGSYITINGGKVTATGGANAAGIGGGEDSSGSNITINGGTVTATSAYGGAGIGSGENYGFGNSGSDITINGGEVTATGGDGGGAGIGGGSDGSASNIFVDPSIVLKAGSSPSSTAVIAPTRTISDDIAGELAGKQYTTVTAPLDPISYIAPVYNTTGDPKSGIQRWDTLSCTDYTVVADASSAVTWNAGWYVVDGANVTLSKGATCNGAVNLILADGAKLTATGSAIDAKNASAGIQVSGSSNSLTIYGQEGQTGMLIATGGCNTSYSAAAGIGGGGYYEDGDGSGSNITINGGVVTATGSTSEYGGGAGIGGGRGANSTGSYITINGGVVTAKGGVSAAGIGGGYQRAGSNIIINGGEVTATGGASAAGIGGGEVNSGSDITINGGEVTANGGNFAAGIGGGSYSSGSNITINSGTVTATGGIYAPGIGSGDGGNAASNIFVDPSIVLKAGSSPSSIAVIAPTREATTDIAGDLAGKRYTTVTAPLDPISYIAPVYNTTGDPKSGIKEWETLSTNDYTVVADASSAVTWNAGWYVVDGADVTLSAGAVCNGAVNLILADGAKLTATKGIVVSGNANSLTIYGQTEQSGQLIATGGNDAAGIGGGSGASGSNITINGGVVTATGGTGDSGSGAGIGGGSDASGSDITINGGNITATCEVYGAGIGGGAYASGLNITINGGEVTATGGLSAAGIGGGVAGFGAYITINGGEVTATSGDNAAGIGGGYSGSGAYITINGGEVTVTGSSNAAGIGSGYESEGAAGYIFVNPSIIIMAGSSPENTEVIAHATITTDVASLLAGKPYTTVTAPVMPEEGDSATVRAALRSLKQAGTPCNMTISRTFYKDGKNNTICLPFALSADQLADSPLAGYSKLQKFVSAVIENKGTEYETLTLTMEDVTAIEAGKPYIIAWPTAAQDLVNPTFTGVTVTREVGDTTVAPYVKFIGSFVKKTVTAGDKGILFVGEGDRLLWPNESTYIKGFRCFFEVDLTASSPLRRGMCAMLGAGKKVPTDVENTNGNLNNRVQKLIEQGRVVIISDGVRYDINGKVIK